MNQKKLNKSKESVNPALNRKLKKAIGEAASETLNLLNLLKLRLQFRRILVSCA